MDFHMLCFFLSGAEMSNFCCLLCCWYHCGTSNAKLCFDLLVHAMCYILFIQWSIIQLGVKKTCVSIWIILVMIKTESVMCWNWQFRITTVLLSSPTCVVFVLANMAWLLTPDFSVFIFRKNICRCSQMVYLSACFFGCIF